MSTDDESLSHYSVFNERKTIEQVVGAVRTAPIKEIEIVIVDDGSTDGTATLLKEKIAPVVDQIIYQPRNRGKAPRGSPAWLPPAAT
jgi:glycosyltransferase involved in cell wall biosynthesis